MSAALNGAARPKLFSIESLPGWVQVEGPGDGTVTVSPEGAADDGLRPSLTGEVRRTPTAVTLPDLRFSHADELAADLDGVRVLDAGVCAVGDHDAHRVLLAHRVDGVDVTLEQWAFPLRRRTVLLTASAPTLRYVELAADLRELVEGFDLHV